MSSVLVLCVGNIGEIAQNRCPTTKHKIKGSRMLQEP